MAWRHRNPLYSTSVMVMGHCYVCDVFPLRQGEQGENKSCTALVAFQGHQWRLAWLRARDGGAILLSNAQQGNHLGFIGMLDIPEHPSSEGRPLIEASEIWLSDYGTVPDDLIFAELLGEWQ